MSIPTPARPERFITVDDLADVLGVPPSWIYERTARGEIPFYRVGRYVRFRLSEVEDWLEQQRLSGGSDGRR